MDPCDIIDKHTRTGRLPLIESSFSEHADDQLYVITYHHLDGTFSLMSLWAANNVEAVRAACGQVSQRYGAPAAAEGNWELAPAFGAGLTFYKNLKAAVEEPAPEQQVKALYEHLQQRVTEHMRRANNPVLGLEWARQPMIIGRNGKPCRLLRVVCQQFPQHPDSLYFDSDHDDSYGVDLRSGKLSYGLALYALLAVWGQIESNKDESKKEQLP